jgi:hypothetical protein
VKERDGEKEESEIEIKGREEGWEREIARERGRKREEGGGDGEHSQAD